MGVMSIRELNSNLSKALARVAAGETLDITNKGKVFAEVRPKKASKLDDPAFRAAYERLADGLREGIPGLSGPATYDERTAR